MAKTPGTPKAKTDAPAQFDMNSRERKGGGKGGRGGPNRGRDEKRPPSQIINLPPTTVDRGEGWVIQKLGRVDQASHAAAGAEYHLVFEGRDPLVFGYLSAARERSKEPPPEIVPEAVPEAVAEVVPEAEAESGSETGPETAEASEGEADPVEGAADPEAPAAKA